MIKLSNGNKLNWFITDGESARLVVGDNMGLESNKEFALSESQKRAIKDLIDKELLPRQVFNKYNAYINKEVIFYDDAKEQHIGYLATVMPKDPDFPFGIYQDKHGECCSPEEAYDVVFVRYIEPIKEDK